MLTPAPAGGAGEKVWARWRKAHRSSYARRPCARRAAPASRAAHRCRRQPPPRLPHRRQHRPSPHDQRAHCHRHGPSCDEARAQIPRRSSRRACQAPRRAAPRARHRATPPPLPPAPRSRPPLPHPPRQALPPALRRPRSSLSRRVRVSARPAFRMAPRPDTATAQLLTNAILSAAKENDVARVSSLVRARVRKQASRALVELPAWSNPEELTPSLLCALHPRSLRLTPRPMRPT